VDDGSERPTLFVSFQTSAAMTIMVSNPSKTRLAAKVDRQGARIAGPDIHHLRVLLKQALEFRYSGFLLMAITP
jgi:hypothetical protein